MGHAALFHGELSWYLPDRVRGYDDWGYQEQIGVGEFESWPTLGRYQIILGDCARVVMIMIMFMIIVTYLSRWLVIAGCSCIVLYVRTYFFRRYVSGVVSDRCQPRD